MKQMTSMKETRKGARFTRKKLMVVNTLTFFETSVAKKNTVDIFQIDYVILMGWD